MTCTPTHDQRPLSQIQRNVKKNIEMSLETWVFTTVFYFEPFTKTLHYKVVFTPL